MAAPDTEANALTRRATLVGVGALLFNAFTWGVSWWPMRWLQAQGLHPLWTTVCIYGVAVAVISISRPQAWRNLMAAPQLWLLVLASGTTNAAFNWAVAVGDVVRVVLLFYLMPVWAVLLARVLLHEAITARALFRVALAMAGAAIVMWPREATSGSAPAVSHSLWVDALAVLGGLAFALNNVMLRREAAQPAQARALAMFLGGVAVAGAVALGLQAGGHITALAWPGLAAAALALGLSFWFLLSNLALQLGAARLRANITAVVMISEVFFAAASAAALGATAATPALWAGGLLIIGAAVLAAFKP